MSEISTDYRAEHGADEPRRLPKPAREKVMDLLARRDHSELELRRKLLVRYNGEEVDDAIEYARQNKWLKPPEELSELVAEQLAQRQKGSRYIRQYLRSKGLPPVARNVEAETQRGLQLAQHKLGCQPPFDHETRVKIQRLLRNRGFDDETIRKVINEKP